MAAGGLKVQQLFNPVIETVLDIDNHDMWEQNTQERSKIQK
jgi:hypothetical protein